MPNTWVCASASRDDVNYYAGDGAGSGSVAHGDTVIIPAGDSTWTSQVVCTKGIHLKGSGQGVTIVRDNLTKNGTDSSIPFIFQINSPQNLRVSDFSYVGVSVDSSAFNKGCMVVTGVSTVPNVRIDHINVDTPACTFLRTNGCIFGVMDHVIHRGNVQSPTPTIALIWMDAFAGAIHGDGSWAQPSTPGGPNAWYIEDCVLEYPTGTTNAEYMVDGWNGSRIVVRYNTFNRSTISSHGTETSGRDRGCRWWEIYHNQFVYEFNTTLVDTNIYWRGGSGVVFNNNVSGAFSVLSWNSFLKLDNWRSYGSWAPWGICDGTGVYDGNDGSPSGYLCLDQPGAGSGRLFDSGNPPSGGDALQVSEPIYVWGNTYIGSSGPPTFGYVSPFVAHIQANRDYYEDTQRPGYAPYIYPHPLTTEDSTFLMGQCLT